MLSRMMSLDPAGSVTDLPRKFPWPKTAPRKASRTGTSLQAAAATASELLWAVVLLLVVGFLVSKGPALSAITQDVAAAVHESHASPAVTRTDADVQELEARLARDENQLALLERRYVEIKQRVAPRAPKEREPPPVQGPKMKPGKSR